MADESYLLPGPMELLDLEHANSVTLSLSRFQQGYTVIHPKVVTMRHIRIYMEQNELVEPPTPGTPISLKVPCLRVFGARVDKASPATYWDITSLTLQAALLPRLIGQNGQPVVLTFTAHGEKPTKRYSIEQA